MKKAPLLVLITGCIMVASSASYANDDANTMKNALIAETHGDAPAPPKFTDEQLEKIHVIKTKYADSGASRMTELHKLHRQLGDALSQVKIDTAEVQSLQAKLSELESQAGQARVQMMIELHDLLTVEQRQQMRRHMLSHDLFGFGGPMHHPGGMGGPGMPPGFGPPHGPGGPDFHGGPGGPGCDL